MRTEYFDCFKAALKHKNFSLAAESMYMSPSAFTKIIKSLEEQLGGSLFIRKGKSQLELSAFGKHMSSYIIQCSDSTNELVKSASVFSSSQQDVLFISTALQTSSTPIIDMLLKIRNKYPSFHYKMIQSNHMTLNHLLKNSLTEICLAYSELIHSHIDYLAIPLCEDPLVLITNKNTAQKKGWENEVSLISLQKEPFYFPTEDMALHNFITSCCKQAGFTPHLDTYCIIQFHSILHLIRGTELCTIVPKSYAITADTSEELQIIPLTDAPSLSLFMYVDILHSKETRNYVMKFIQNYYESSVK